MKAPPVTTPFPGPWCCARTGRRPACGGHVAAFHGRGFGRQLVNGAADIARAQGLVALRLDTFPHNVRGRGLYESCGFEDKGEWTVHYPALGDIQVAMYELAL